MSTIAGCYSYNGRYPSMGDGSFVAAGARIIGDVTAGHRCGVWYNAVIRGDVQRITIGNESNIQDGCVLHVDHGPRGALVVGSRVTVGHAAVLHACTIMDEVLIGMGATVLNEATVERHAMVAAGSVVTPRTHIPEGQLFGGVPAKYLRDLTAQEVAYLATSAAHYVRYAAEHAAEQRRYSANQ